MHLIQRAALAASAATWAEGVTTLYPAATGFWRPTHVINQPPCEEERLMAHPPHPFVAQIEEGSTCSIV